VSALAALYSPTPATVREVHKPTPSPNAEPKQWLRGECQDAIFAALARGTITPFELAVGVALSRFADNKTGKAWPSTRAIAEKVGAKVDARGLSRGVSRAIATLKREGLLQVTQRYNTSSIYVLKVGLDLPQESGQTRLRSPANSVKGTPPMTESGKSFEGSTKPTMVLDDEMGKIAIEAEMDDWAIEDQFRRFLVLNKNTARLHHPKAAWKRFCERYKRPTWLDWDGLPQWCPELWTIAIKAFPDERAAERHFYKALKRRDMRRKGKGKPKPIGNVAGWWKAVCKAYVPEEPTDRRQRESIRLTHPAPEPREQKKDDKAGWRPDGQKTGWRTEKLPHKRPDGEGGFIVWNEESPGSSESKPEW
jgi:hypothetical protein